MTQKLAAQRSFCKTWWPFLEAESGERLTRRFFFYFKNNTLQTFRITWSMIFMGVFRLDVTVTARYRRTVCIKFGWLTIIQWSYWDLVYLIAVNASDIKRDSRLRNWQKSPPHTVNHNLSSEKVMDLEKNLQNFRSGNLLPHAIRQCHHYLSCHLTNQRSGNTNPSLHQVGWEKSLFEKKNNRL